MSVIYVCLECEIHGEHLWVEVADGQALWVECECCGLLQ